MCVCGLNGYFIAYAELEQCFKPINAGRSCYDMEHFVHLLLAGLYLKRKPKKTP